MMSKTSKICETCGWNDYTCTLCGWCVNHSRWIPKSKTPQFAPKNNEIENKAQMSLIPMDLLAEFLEPAYREGLIKYSRESWRDGFNISTMIDALRRHEKDFYHSGEDLDPDALKLGVEKHHLGGMLFCVLCMCDTITNHPEMDDRQKRNESKASVIIDSN